MKRKIEALFQLKIKSVTDLEIKGVSALTSKKQGAWLKIIS